MEQAQGRGGEELSPCGGGDPEPGGLSTCVLSDRKGQNWIGRRKSARMPTFIRHSAPAHFGGVALRTTTGLRSFHREEPMLPGHQIDPKWGSTGVHEASGTACSPGMLGNVNAKNSDAGGPQASSRLRQPESGFEDLNCGFRCPFPS